MLPAAHDSMHNHGQSKPHQLLTQTLLKITGFAVINHLMTAMQSTQEKTPARIHEPTQMAAIIGMLVAELKEQSSQRLKDNTEYQGILNFAGDAEEPLKIYRH